MIDGGNQARVGKSEIAVVANRVFDHVEAWTEAYGKQRVYRRVLFVRPSYWIVSDFIRADNATPTAEHTYEQVWHPEAGAEPMIDSETQRIQNWFAVGANVQLVPADPGEVRANISDGWMEGRQAKSVWFKQSPLTGDLTDVVVPCSATVKQALLNGKDLPLSRKDDAVRIDGG